MDLFGLQDDERDRLGEAGFDAAVTAAVADEAATMRFLWLRRSGFNAVTGVAGAAGAAAVANIFAEDFGPLAIWLPILLPLIAAGLGVAPWWEIRQVKPISRPRWAARKLAALAVAADPDDETDDEWVELQTLALAAADAQGPTAALRAVADALDAGALDDGFTLVLGGARASADPEPPSDAAAPSPPRNPAPSRMAPAPARSMTPDQRDRLHDALRTGVILTALAALLVLLLIRRGMGG